MSNSKIKKAVSNEDTLLDELFRLIEHSQQQLISQANSTLTMMFWFIGSRINQTILQINGQIMANRLSLHCHDNWHPNTVVILKKRI